MGLHKTYLGRLSLAAAATPVSNVLAARELVMMKGLTFHNPAYTGVVSVKVGPKDDTLAAAMTPLRVAGAAVTLTASTVQFIECSGFESLAISSAGTEASERDVEVYAILDL